MQIFRPDLRAHRVVIFSSNYLLYGGTFQRVMATLREFGPNVEVYSIDEVFMDLHGMQVDWQGYGHKIRNTLWHNIRMPVGVGIAPSKTLKKLANRGAKPPPKCDGVCVLDTPQKWQ
ncbi:hypothetical protein ACJJIC_11015 [Microbulbifer sp. ANSA002]|uniref:Y-family DNA polymerase n=1 Tax=unclassified Microbulbifer TaxID=2619833 RepID=UPI0040416067